MVLGILACTVAFALWGAGNGIQAFISCQESTLLREPHSLPEAIGNNYLFQSHVGRLRTTL